MSKKEISALEAKFEAQKIAFAPIVFQVARTLIKLGILEAIRKERKGIQAEALALQTEQSLYGINVLLEMALTANIVEYDKNTGYSLAKIGYFLLNDEMTKVNLNFTHDVCYKGLYHLEEAITTQTPAGLKELGDWNTIYEGLPALPGDAKKSWFEFDHFYSDDSFPKALDIVFKNKPKHILDIGGNTGKWSLKCCERNSEVSISILDLPGQLKLAQGNIVEAGQKHRVNLIPTNVLSPELLFPKADVLWMSQFLDCFSNDEIVNILSHATKNMDKDTELFIMETFWDNQRFEAASFSLTATSIYFTVMANGNSKMYGKNEMIKLIESAGLKVVEEFPEIGISHTILKCMIA